jgi:xanthine phosphoribosyltransferase
MDKIYVDWIKFQRDCELLAAKIKISGQQFKSIVAITRGGLFVAGALSYLLDIKEVQTLHIESYDSHDKKGKVKLFSKGIDFEDCLLVDDLTDTGDTLQCVLDWQLVNIPSAVLYKKLNSVFEPTFWAEEFNDDWIVFPWDVMVKPVMVKD